MYRESGKALKGVQNDLPMQDLYIRPQGVFCSVSSRQLVNLSRNHFKVHDGSVGLVYLATFTLR